MLEVRDLVNWRSNNNNQFKEKGRNKIQKRYLVLWGDLKEDLFEQQGHNRVGIDGFLERLDSRLVGYIVPLPMFGDLEVVIEEGLVDNATFREPSTVAAEGCRRRHCPVERYQRGGERQEERNSL